MGNEADPVKQYVWKEQFKDNIPNSFKIFFCKNKCLECSELSNKRVLPSLWRWSLVDWNTCRDIISVVCFAGVNTIAFVTSRYFKMENILSYDNRYSNIASQNPIQSNILLNRWKQFYSAYKLGNQMTSLRVFKEWTLIICRWCQASMVNNKNRCTHALGIFEE